jgi:hypothetical protein
MRVRTCGCVQESGEREEEKKRRNGRKRRKRRKIPRITDAKG